jgi:hypothetical protein
MDSPHATDLGNALTQEFAFDQAGVATLGRILSTSATLSGATKTLPMNEHRRCESSRRSNTA